MQLRRTRLIVTRWIATMWLSYVESWIKYSGMIPHLSPSSSTLSFFPPFSTSGCISHNWMIHEYTDAIVAFYSNVQIFLYFYVKEGFREITSGKKERKKEKEKDNM